MNSPIEKKYIIFQKVGTSESGKTEVWNVISKDNDDVIGIIRWHGQWRQYSFWPEPDTLYNNGCLNDISEFMTELMKEWRKRKNQEKEGKNE